MWGPLLLLLGSATGLLRAPGRGVRGLALRAAPVADLRREIAALLEPYGSPALGVPADVAAAVDEKCRTLEASAPPAPLDMLEGAWRVAYSTAPSPSNGALGPFRGVGLQVVDVAGRAYVNELALGPLTVRLRASFEPRSDSELRVAFESIEASLFGTTLVTTAFPPGVERTWLLTYTDATTRVVRAGVDGGRSLAREAGLVSGGEAKDAYLFYLTRAPAS